MRPKDYTIYSSRSFTPILFAVTSHQIGGMDDVGSYLGQRIKECREAAQLTQADLAQLTLKSVETISNFERGRTVPSVQTLSVLAGNLGVNIRDFFDQTPVQTDSSGVDIAIRNKSRLLT